MKDNFKLNFYRFDGDGGGASAGEGSAEASAQAQSDKPQIVYGKSQDEGGASQVGADKGRQAEDLDAEFASLVGKGGRFHEIYGRKVSETVERRFKNQSDLQAEINDMHEDLAPMYMNYGLEVGDFEGLKNAMANDEAFYKTGAEKAGLTVEQYKNQLKLQADSDRLHKITESYERERQIQAAYQKAEADAEELRTAFPNFDLGFEMENNEEFRELLRSGVDVKRAFFAAHAEDIFAGANNAADMTARQNAAQAIRQRAARPMESAMNYSPAIERRSDPSKLTNEDMDKIDEIVMNGGIVSF